MGVTPVNVKTLEEQKAIQEALEGHDPATIENPVLKRCAERNQAPKPDVHQAYDRMHHRHNRT